MDMNIRSRHSAGASLQKQALTECIQDADSDTLAVTSDTSDRAKCLDAILDVTRDLMDKRIARHIKDDIKTAGTGIMDSLSAQVARYRHERDSALRTTTAMYKQNMSRESDLMASTEAKLDQGLQKAHQLYQRTVDEQSRLIKRQDRALRDIQSKNRTIKQLQEQLAEQKQHHHSLRVDAENKQLNGQLHSYMIQCQEKDDRIAELMRLVQVAPEAATATLSSVASDPGLAGVDATSTGCVSVTDYIPAERAVANTADNDRIIIEPVAATQTVDADRANSETALGATQKVLQEGESTTAQEKEGSVAAMDLTVIETVAAHQTATQIMETDRANPKGVVDATQKVLQGGESTSAREEEEPVAVTDLTVIEPIAAHQTVAHSMETDRANPGIVVDATQKVLQGGESTTAREEEEPVAATGLHALVGHKVYAIREVKDKIIRLCNESDLPDAVKQILMDQFSGYVQKLGVDKARKMMQVDSKCASTAVTKSTCTWTKQHPGLYACKTCHSVKDGRVCWRWSSRLEAFVVLPLVTGDGSDFAAPEGIHSRSEQRELFGGSDAVDEFRNFAFGEP